MKSGEMPQFPLIGPGSNNYGRDDFDQLSQQELKNIIPAIYEGADAWKREYDS